MIGPQVALISLVLYLLMLFGIAQYAVRQKFLGKSVISNPYVYALSLCVYVSAWTFYGSIGRAASTGLAFLPIYLGPTLAMLLGWLLIRKMIRVSKEFRLTSISDFISFRYGRSYTIGAVVAVFSLVAIIPYVALQLIAISTSLDVLSGQHLYFFGMTVERRLVVSALLGAFAILFGARHLDPMEHHEGLIAVVAFESMIKLIAFLSAGIFVTYGIFGGYGAILERISASPGYTSLTNIDYAMWFSLMLISFFSILFLPRQFHVMVVENSDENHLKKAMWVFPLYLLLINIFVPAIAWGGLILNTPGLKDAFIIAIPYERGQDLLALFIFLGGASAATAMILVESVAVGTMLLNDLELPYLLRRIGGGRNLPRLLLNMRRLNILLVVFLGYVYSGAVEYLSLADIGSVSFLAVSQFAPAALGGLYWKRGSRKGAIAGLTSGFLLWIYTALIPTVAGAGWISKDLLKNGPFGITFLKPTALFGMNLDIWTHSVFWTLLINCSLYVIVSMISMPKAEESSAIEGYIDVYQKAEIPLKADLGKIRMGTVDELEKTLATYIGGQKAGLLVDADLARLGTTRERIDAKQLLELWHQLEKTLTGSVGPAAARMIIEDTVPIKHVVEALETTMPSYRLKTGEIYVVPEKPYEVFRDQITHGIEGLCITYRDPEEIRIRWGFKETPIIKLGQGAGDDRSISLTNLPLLFMTIRSFVESSSNSIVLIDSLEYLVDKDVNVVPERDILDFVYEIETLSRKTRIVLAEGRGFVHKELPGEVNAVKELLFTLGPLSMYLFKTFSDAMLAGLDEMMKGDVIDEVNSLIASGAFFEEVKTLVPADDSTSACEPDMRSAVKESAAALKIDPHLVLTRRDFFIALRRLARVIKRYDPRFNIMTAVGELMKSYGRSPYEISLIPGTTYVIEEEKPNRSFELFAELVNHDMDGLCISRSNPDILNERFNVPIETIIWLTQKSEPGFKTVDPTNFPRMSSMIAEFLDKANYPVMLLEGVGYLITQSNYETVLRFIQSQRDEIALKNAVMIVYIDPLSLDTKELHRMESELEPLKINDFLNS